MQGCATSAISLPGTACLWFQPAGSGQLAVSVASYTPRRLGRSPHPTRNPPHRVLGWGPLLLILVLVLAVLATSLWWSQSDSQEHGLSAWLALHPPRRARHDNELLRRRKLASMEELLPAGEVQVCKSRRFRF